MEMPYDLVGQKAILNYLRLTTWRDVMTRVKCGLPAIKEPGGRRWLARSTEIEEWMLSNAV